MAASTTRRPTPSIVKTAAPSVVAGFNEHELLTSASAIAFRILFALVPVALFTLAVASFLELANAWTLNAAPRVAPFVSPGVFAALNETILPVLASRQGFWLTAGGLLALWEVSSGVRAVMDALNKVYRSERERSVTRRMGVSFLLALGLATCLTLSITLSFFGPFTVLGLDQGLVFGVLDFVTRWALAIGLLFAAVALLVRYAPTNPQPLRWVSFGSILTVVMWTVFSLGFGWYVTAVSSYSLVFGGLASIIVLMTYLYLSAVVFLAGVQFDEVIRECLDEDTASEE